MGKGRKWWGGRKEWDQVERSGKREKGRREKGEEGERSRRRKNGVVGGAIVWRIVLGGGEVGGYRKQEGTWK